MTSARQGGQAFPVPAGTFNSRGDDMWHPTEGMTLRDWFAGQALNGLCQRLDAAAVKRWLAGEADGREAVVAYQLADAMLKARDDLAGTTGA